MEALVIALPAIFFIVDPIGIVPLYVAMTANDTPEKCRAMARRACMTAALVLLAFGLFGGVIFRVFGVSLAAFRVAGGLLLILTALDMLRAKPAATRTSPAEHDESVAQEDVAIVPLAMPLLAGPGAIATVMTLMAQYGKTVLGAASVLGAVVITFMATYVVLARAPAIKRVLKQTGIAILERVFGLILAAIAVQFMFEGGKALLAAP